MAGTPYNMNGAGWESLTPDQRAQWIHSMRATPPSWDALNQLSIISGYGSIAPNSGYGSWDDASTAAWLTSAISVRHDPNTVFYTAYVNCDTWMSLTNAAKFSIASGVLNGRPPWFWTPDDIRTLVAATDAACTRARVTAKIAPGAIPPR
jgi:hypothetical protein